MTHRPSATSRSAFTLIELLVVIAIIVALIAILLPALNKAMLVARRAREASATKQLALACVQYAAEHRMTLPLGATNTTYNMASVDREAFELLRDRYAFPFGESPEAFGCSAWTLDTPTAGFFYELKPTKPDIARIPWVYWGNRPDHELYDFPQRLTESGTATSDTLLTCYGRRSNSSFPSHVPHIGAYGDAGQVFEAGAPWVPPDDWCVGRLDTSVHWIDFADTEPFADGVGGSSEFFYDPGA